MIKLLRKNYSLTLWLTRLVYGLALLLGQMFYIDTAAGWITMLTGYVVRQTWSFYVIFAIVSTAMYEIIIRLGTRLVFNFSRLVIIPFGEFVILMMWAGAVINVMSGLIKLVYLLSPAAMVFGEWLITFVVSAFVYFGLFMVVKKLYLNDKNAPYVFKVGALVFLMLSVINLVVL